MFKQNTLVAEPTDVIPTNSKPLPKAQAGIGRRVPDRAARLAQANELLKHEIKERRHAEELLQKEQRYLRYMLELQDRDRQMVSCEIHDGLVQQLAAAMMQFEIFSRATRRKAKAVWKTFENGLAMLSESMREARRLINGLRSPILDELGVVAAIEDLIVQGNAQEKPQIEFVHHLDRERMAPSLENVIFRIVQESLANARRYSQSEQVLIRLFQRDDSIRIEVQDWGIGFNLKGVGEGHFGLEGIQERARLFGGSATLKSTLGKGTRIVVQLPLMGDVGTAAEPDESPAAPATSAAGSCRFWNNVACARDAPAVNRSGYGHPPTIPLSF
jgi:signal transduction histidine kinase